MNRAHPVSFSPIKLMDLDSVVSEWTFARPMQLQDQTGTQYLRFHRLHLDFQLCTYGIENLTLPSKFFI